jgi:hypothetical protein
MHLSRFAGLFVLLPLLQVSACSGGSSSTGTGPGGSGGPGGDPTSPGTNPDGSPSSDHDSDDDASPAWDGTLAHQAALVADDVYDFAATDDGQIVYSTLDAIMVKPAAGGAAKQIGTGTTRHLVHAGRVAFVIPDEGEDTLAYSSAAGARTLTGVSLANTGAETLTLTTTASASGDLILITGILENPLEGQSLAPSKQSVWLLDANTLDVTVVDKPNANGQVAGCVAVKEQFFCSALTTNDHTEVWAVDKAGAHVQATIAESSYQGYAQPTAGTDVVYAHTKTSLYEVSTTTAGTPQKIADAPSSTLLQGGWLGASGLPSAPADVLLMKTDGSSSKTAATGATVPYIADGDSTMTSRLRWLPICDLDAKGKQTNLRFYQPATGKTVQASTSCRVVAMTYSDNYVLFYDDWTETPNDPFQEGNGTLVVFDLRDGSRRADPGFDATGTTFAVPLEKDKLFIYSSSPAGVSDTQAWFFDANSPADTKGAHLASGIAKTQLIPNTGAVYMTRSPNDQTGKAYYVAW